MTASVGIVNYGLGNLTSVAGAIDRVGGDPVVSNDPAVLARCNKLVLPGVGAFGDGVRNMTELGLVEALQDLVVGKRKPLLGICLGSQLVTRSSEEFGTHEGLGWFDARVKRLVTDNPSLRVPHVGWDDLECHRESILFEGIPDDALFYYVHSYAIETNDTDVVVATCDYGFRFVAAMEHENIYATQFHPEKSQRHGLQLLENFIRKA